MARSPSYNRDAALDTALDLFWKKGYHATSLKDLEAALAGVVAEEFAVLDGELPLLPRRDDFLLPDIFSDHEQIVFRAERHAHVEIAFAALDVKALHGRVEIH